MWSIKKILDEALSAAAKSGRTNHPQLLAVSRARLINQQLGGAFVAPWEVEHLDEIWLDVFAGLQELPDLRKNYQEFEKLLIERRNSNPGYRKYLRN